MTCKHCGRPITRSEREDAEDAGMRGGYCTECTDSAVYGADCDSCERPIGAGRCDA